METIASVLKSLSFDPVLFWFQFVMFFVFHYTLKGLLYGPLMRVRLERDGKVSGRLKEAEQVAAAARQLKTDYDEAIRSARLEAQAVLAQADHEGKTHKEARVAEAREEARKVIEEAQLKVEAERQAALTSLQADIKELSTSIVDRLVSPALKGADKEKLLSKIRSAS